MLLCLFNWGDNTVMSAVGIRESLENVSVSLPLQWGRHAGFQMWGDARMQNTESLPTGFLQVFKTPPGATADAVICLFISPSASYLSTLCLCLSFCLPLNPSLSFSLLSSGLHTDLLSLPTSPDQRTAGKSKQARQASLHLLQLCVCARACFTVRRLPTHTTLSRALSLHSASSVDHSTLLRINCVHACANLRALKAKTHSFESPEVNVFFVFWKELQPPVSMLRTHNNSYLHYFHKQLMC